MAIYSLGSRSSNFTVNQACWELRTTSSMRAVVLQVEFFIATGTAVSIGLGRPAAIGVTPTSPVTVLQEDSAAQNGNSQVALAWGTSPTAPSNYLRRWNGPATVGAGIIWTFPRGLVVPVSSSIVIFNITTNVAADINVVLDE